MRLVERVERIILGAYKKELANSALSGTTLLGQLAKKALSVFSFVSLFVTRKLGQIIWRPNRILIHRILILGCAHEATSGFRGQQLRGGKPHLFADGEFQ